jgi:hypothetical protein
VREKHQEKQWLKRPFLVKRLSQFMTCQCVPVARQKSKQSAIKRPADKALITKLHRKVRKRRKREKDNLASSAKVSKKKKRERLRERNNF